MRQTVAHVRKNEIKVVDQNVNANLHFDQALPRLPFFVLIIGDKSVFFGGNECNN